MSSTDSYWIICNEQNEICHCDWRVNVRGCFERNSMHIIYLINVVWTLIGLAFGTKLCYTRMYVNRQPIFERSSTSSFLVRPRPIEALLFFGYIFNVLRVVSSLIMVLDVVPNQIFRAFLYEFPWQTGFAAFACYLFGIAHTISNNSKVVRNKWFKSGSRIDALCIILICLPFISNNICSIGSGVYATRGDFVTADMFTKGLYYCWAIYCFTLATMIMSAGLRLLKILSQHVGNQLTHNSGTQKIKHGMFKIKIIMAVSTVSLYVFAFIKLMYAIMRPRLLENTGLNLVFALIWTFDGTAASSLIVVTLFINPKALTPIGMSSDQSSTSRIDRSKFIASASITSTEFDYSKTKTYNTQFENIDEYDEEKFQMGTRYDNYHVPETGSEISKATLVTHAG